MRLALTRRALLACAVASGAAHAAGSSNPFAELERRSGVRLGVFILDPARSGAPTWRGDERFNMCSTFKALLAALVLARIDAGVEHPDRPISYTAAELLPYAPVTKAHVASGRMTVDALAAAAVEWSDNTAANLLLGAVGGPRAVTEFVRRLGDPVTRLDRIEPSLNVPDGDLDTTTPRAMASTLHAILLGDVLKPASRARLEAWMIACQTGLKRLRAGLPRGWTVGDRTGTWRTTANDLALVRPPDRPPFIITAFVTAPAGGRVDPETVLADIGRIAARGGAG